MARRAIIRVSASMLASLLQLPAGYRPVSVSHLPEREQLVLVVEHLLLPDVPAGQVLPDLEPIYRSCHAQHAVLERIKGGP
jgi:hypothetical protein